MIFSRTLVARILTALYMLLAILAIAVSAGRTANGQSPVAAEPIATASPPADAASTKSPEQASSGQKETADEAEPPYQPKSKAELRKMLTRMQYRVTQEEHTEPAFRNEYWDNKKEGVYRCIVCEQELFTSETKFESGTGWPSFWLPIDPERLGTKTDWKMVYPRTEVHCGRCEAHLGHVFQDGPPPTGLRYCLNSASLRFVPETAAAATKEDAPLLDR